MKLRTFDPDRDFDRIKSWIADARAHALWCANRFQYPLDRDNFTAVLSDMAQKEGDVPFTAAADSENAVGFFCRSSNPALKECRLKFVIVDPECRGKGIAREMLRLAIAGAFEDTGAEAVSLCVFPQNPAAKRCYEKTGFTEERTDCKAFAFGDELWDRCHMAVRKADPGEKMKQVFESENISYVEVTEQLIPDYLGMVNDIEHVDRFIGGWHEPYTEEQEASWVREQLEKKAPVFSMIEKKTGGFIGNVELMNVADAVGEIGIAVTAKKQGQGYGTEAVRAITEYGRNVLQLKRIVLRTNLDNSRAIHVYEKCGFREFRRTDKHVCMEIS